MPRRKARRLQLQFRGHSFQACCSQWPSTWRSVFLSRWVLRFAQSQTCLARSSLTRHLSTRTDLQLRTNWWIDRRWLRPVQQSLPTNFPSRTNQQLDHWRLQLAWVLLPTAIILAVALGLLRRDSPYALRLDRAPWHSWLSFWDSSDRSSAYEHEYLSLWACMDQLGHSVAWSSYHRRSLLNQTQLCCWPVEKTAKWFARVPR